MSGYQYDDDAKDEDGEPVARTLEPLPVRIDPPPDLRSTLQRAVRRSDSPLERAHHAAMNAKEATFIAQDVCSAGWLRASKAQQRELRKFEKRLARVRAELEALDRQYLSARHRGVT